MQSRRLEDRIRELCYQMIRTKDESLEFELIAFELEESLAEYSWRIRTRLLAPPSYAERRKNLRNNPNISGGRAV